MVSPAQITTATDWKAVSSGGAHTCAIRGALYCWGTDNGGQAGNGSATGNVAAPAKVTTATDWTAVSGGSSHACALRGKLYCWGNDSNGAVGAGAGAGGVVTAPVQVG